MMAKGMKSHFRRRKAPRVKRALDRMQEVPETIEAKPLSGCFPYGA